MGFYTNFSDQQLVFARLARAIGRGHNAIYHGTRYPGEVLGSGKLKPDPTGKVSFSRSPQVAAYFATLIGDRIWAPALLVLNRSTLIQTYRLDPWRYGGKDWVDEQEEVVRGRTINFGKHLLGFVGESDVNNVLDPLERELSQKGRARVREMIIEERKRLSTESARLQTSMPAQYGQAIKEDAAAPKIEVKLSCKYLKRKDAQEEQAPRTRLGPTGEGVLARCQGSLVQPLGAPLL